MGLSQQHGIARSRMVQSDLGTLRPRKDSRDTVQALVGLEQLRRKTAVDVHVGNLVVADGERPAGEGIQLFAEWPVACVQQARCAQGQVQQNWLGRLHVRILVYHPHMGADPACRVQQRLTRRVQFTHQLRPITSLRPKPLRVVIQVRQINERQLRWSLRRRSTSAAAPAIHCVLGKPAIGPQNDANGKAPSFALSRPVHSSGSLRMSNTLLPSAP